MEAKDTIMGDDDIHSFAHYPDVNLLSEDNWSIDKMLEDQAEISFKAGIKEVVDWVEERHLLSNRQTDAWCEWQAQLKEWEVE